MQTISSLEIKRNELKEQVREYSNTYFHQKTQEWLKQELTRVEERLMMAKNAIKSQKSPMNMAATL